MYLFHTKGLTGLSVHTNTKTFLQKSHGDIDFIHNMLMTYNEWDQHSLTFEIIQKPSHTIEKSSCTLRDVVQSYHKPLL